MRHQERASDDVIHSIDLGAYGVAQMDFIPYISDMLRYGIFRCKIHLDRLITVIYCPNPIEHVVRGWKNVVKYIMTSHLHARDDQNE